MGIGCVIGTHSCARRTDKTKSAIGTNLGNWFWGRPIKGKSTALETLSLLRGISIV